VVRAIDRDLRRRRPDDARERRQWRAAGDGGPAIRSHGS
jgi:hypothetical protein